MGAPGTFAVLNLGSIIPTSVYDLNAPDANPQHPPGTMSYMSDSFGLRMFRYGRCRQTGGATIGELTEREALVTGTVTAAAGETNDTTHLSDTGNFTADAEEYKICMINTAGAAAPAGECAGIVSNTANTLTLDAAYPLSAAPAAADTYSDYGHAHFVDAVAATNRIDVTGVLMSSPALNDYCWSHVYGIHPAARTTAAALTAGGSIVSGAVAVADRAAEAVELIIGYAIAATEAGAASGGVFLDVLDGVHTV